MNIQRCKLVVVLLFVAAGGVCLLAPRGAARGGGSLDEALASALNSHGFTGHVEATLEERLGRKIDPRLADLGRNLFHDTLLSLNDDNSCAGCHAAPAGFGDTQSIAIGVENNNVVGPDRTGPRNQRRTPMVLNTAFFPTLMWNSRFAAVSGDPFDNSAGFQFPAPEGLSLSDQPHLLAAQAFIPPTERVEAAGFHFPGTNDDLRDEVLRRLNATPAYRKLFGKSFPEVEAGAPISFRMVGRALSEFEFTLTFADAPIDRFARGQRGAMTEEQKRGALLFFGRAGCVECHAVAGQSNEMFSDFRQHVAGVPQIAPSLTNVTFDGPAANEDFGLEQVTGNPDDRYMFRTSPLRNVALQPAFFHNGAFTRLEEAIKYHLGASALAPLFDPATAGLDPDLTGPPGPFEPVLLRLDFRLAAPISLTDEEFRQLVEFVRTGLLDPRAQPERLRRLIPRRVPSGRPLHIFQ